MMMGTCKGGHATGYPPSHLDWNVTGMMLRSISVRSAEPRMAPAAPAPLPNSHSHPVGRALEPANPTQSRLWRRDWCIRRRRANF